MRTQWDIYNEGYADGKDFLADRIKQLEQKLSDLKEAGNSALSDMNILLKNQKKNYADGSYLVDGQSAHELNILINKPSSVKM